MPRSRRSFPAVEKSLARVMKAVTSKALITPSDLEDGGKLNPAQGLPGGSGIKKPLTTKPRKKPEEPKADIKVTEDDKDVTILKTRFFAEFIQKSSDEQVVTAVVLQPEVVDAHGDIISKDVIKKAAHNFLAKFNKATKLGLMHKNFAKNFELLESYVAPGNIVINGITVKEGAWIMTVRVLSAAIWKQIKEGKIKGFSIGGKARVVKLAA